MAKIVYFSLTGQTRRFVHKISHAEILEIESHNPFIEMQGHFILVVPTYVEEITEPVADFLMTGQNIAYCAGAFGGGNRNFGSSFCFTVHDLARAYGIPVLHEFEFQGSKHDVRKLEQELKKIENQKHQTKPQSNLLQFE